MTRLDPCGNDPILYTIGTSGTWIHSMDDVFPVQMVYENESGKLMLHHPSFFKIKSYLCSSGSNQYHKKHSITVIKKGFYVGSCSDVASLLGDGCFVKIGRQKIHSNGWDFGAQHKSILFYDKCKHACSYLL